MIAVAGCVSTAIVGIKDRDSALGPPLYRIAFMADVHFHDVYADLTDGPFEGPANTISRKQATMRTMAAQLRSTRLFNENYFAFLAALDDAMARGIEHVALPGDFSDDGQPVHIRGLDRILDRYTDKGVRFYLTPGNHDPSSPFGRPAGKPDYLGAAGRAVGIFSPGAGPCQDSAGSLPDRGAAAPAGSGAYCSADVAEMGYEGLYAWLGDHGLFPQASDRYWETPYSGHAVEDYEFGAARVSAGFEDRQYEVCREGTGGPYRKPHYRECTVVPDASYLVEPVDGIWLLAIDANVFVPLGSNSDVSQPFAGASNAGYNRLVTHKAHLLDWIESVTHRARELEKRLIVFSHYPMGGFEDHQSGAIATLLGVEHDDVARHPAAAVTALLAERGVRIHLAGHMHVNDTEVTRVSDEVYLVNIQVPSLGAYVPAYKVLTVHEGDKISVETIELSEVPRFKELFEHYEVEHAFLTAEDSRSTWDRSILDSQSYREFTDAHLRALTVGRYLPEDWYPPFRDALLAMSGLDLLRATGFSHSDAARSCGSFENCIAAMSSSPWNGSGARSPGDDSGLPPRLVAEMESWDGLNLAIGFYRIRAGDRSAWAEIGRDRLCQYRLLARSLETSEPHSEFDRQDQNMSFRDFLFLLRQLLEVIEASFTSEPAGNFLIELDSGTISRLENSSREAAAAVDCGQYLQ